MIKSILFLFFCLQAPFKIDSQPPTLSDDYVDYQINLEQQNIQYFNNEEDIKIFYQNLIWNGKLIYHKNYGDFFNSDNSHTYFSIVNKPLVVIKINNTEGEDFVYVPNILIDFYTFSIISNLVGFSSRLNINNDLVFSKLIDRNSQINDLLYPYDFDGQLFLIKHCNYKHFDTPTSMISKIWILKVEDKKQNLKRNCSFLTEDEQEGKKQKLVFSDL